MTEDKTVKHYDLEERTLRFARQVIELVNALPKTIPNVEISKQLIRSSGSIGANYLEANGALGKRDFMMRLRICRKEANETKYWLSLIEVRGENIEQKRKSLLNEVTQLTKIFGSIIEKTR